MQAMNLEKRFHNEAPARSMELLLRHPFPRFESIGYARAVLHAQPRYEATPRLTTGALPTIKRRNEK